MSYCCVAIVNVAMVESRRLLHDDGGNTELLLLHGDGDIGGGSAVGQRWRRWSWQRWWPRNYCCAVMEVLELLCDGSKYAYPG